MTFCIAFILFFFFQAEDGIRDWSVTGVQTCALPIFEYAHALAMLRGKALRDRHRLLILDLAGEPAPPFGVRQALPRSEERRVGKECSSRWSPTQYKQKHERQKQRAGRNGINAREEYT